MTPRLIFSNRLSHLVHANFGGEKEERKFLKEKPCCSGFHECEIFQCKSREGLWALFDLP